MSRMRTVLATVLCAAWAHIASAHLPRQPTWPTLVSQSGVTSATCATVLVGRGTEFLQYDADGNLTNTSLWALRWDGASQLVALTSRPEVPASHRLALRFDYDPLGRRVAKTVSNWVQGAWQLGDDLRFVYAGWNLQAVLSADGQPRLTFTWGQDLSGSFQGVGGIGGLLSLRVHGGVQAGTYHYVYDARGNVVGLVDAATGAWAARYEYGPFHELLRATGPLARVNPFLSATKYYDWETGFSYYGYRYYDPGLGRWLNRDPVGEAGGLNLYGFVGNEPVGVFDPDGLQPGVRYVPPPRPVEPLLRQIEFELQLRGEAVPSRMFGRAARVRMAEEFLARRQFFPDTELRAAREPLRSVQLELFRPTPEEIARAVGQTCTVEAGASVPAWRFAEVRPAIRALRKAGVSPEKIREAIQSFQPGTLSTRTLTADEFGIRLYGGQSGPTSPYLSPTFPGGNARELFAPWPGNTLQNIQQWRIPTGTTVLEGRVAPAFGQPGGGYPIYVPNPETTLQLP